MRYLPVFLLYPIWLLPHSLMAQPPADPVKPAQPWIFSEYQSLFDGQSFDGWEGDTQHTWRIEDGSLVAGSLELTVPRNEFLATAGEFENIELRLKYKLIGTEGFINGGVQLRSKRIPNHHEVSGYQADLGMGYDGALYDESRRNKVLSQPDEKLLKQILKPEDWNQLRIRAAGPRIQIWLNDVLTVDYVEEDADLPRKGIIALQIHGGCKAIVRYKDIEIRELPDIDSVSRIGSPPVSQPVQTPFAQGKFSLDPEDVVVLTGQTDTVRMRDESTLECLLTERFATAKPRFRNMAWEGDTVYEQWRDLNFGTWSDQLSVVGATVVFAQFGQMEALDGPDRLDEFKTAYERLLNQFTSQTSRVVLITPHPFERPDSPQMPDHSEKNQTVKEYVDAIRTLADRRSALFVDLFTPFEHHAPRLTSNGIHLTPEGQGIVAGEIALQLGLPQPHHRPANALRAAVVEKNRLWFDNWRPMNWTFAYGDRTAQPFSKPGGDHPALGVELKEFQPLIRAADARIHELSTTGAASPATSTASVPLLERPVAAQEHLPTDSVDHSVEAELRSFTLADGFDVNLFASEADGVVNPLQMRWDDAGRLWVLCAPTYPQIEPGAAAGDYLVVCEDTTGDGRADTFRRFAEGLFMPMGIEFGDGGVYLAEATELVHLRDTDGDGRADSRTVLLSGFGTADAHQMINGLSWGPGGELWFGQGHHIYSHVETPWGIERLHKSGVWRYRVRTGRLDGFFNLSTAGLNCQGVASDDWGQIFHNSAAYSGGFYTVPGMIRTLHPRNYWAMVTPDRRNTGIEFIGTRHLPDDLQGCVVWSGYLSNNVHLHRLVETGSGFVGEKLPDLMRSSRREFRPVNVRIGPDGAIYVCDWYNPLIGHYQASYRDPQRDKSHGRIWRVTARGRPLVRQQDWNSLSPTDLLVQLKSPERFTRAQAKRRMWDLSTNDAVAAADAWLTTLDPHDPQYEHLLVEVMGVYEGHETVRPALLNKLLEASDPRAQAYGTRVIGSWADRLSDPLSLLEKQIVSEHPRVRLEAIVASSSIPTPHALEVAMLALDRPRDEFINYALAQTVHALKPYWFEPLARGELTFRGSSEQLQFVLETDGSRDVARLTRQLASDDLTPRPVRERLLSLLVNVGTPDDLRFSLDNAPRSGEVLGQLATVAAVHGRLPAGDLLPSVELLLADDDSQLRAVGMRLAGAWKLKQLAPAIRDELGSSRAGSPVLEAGLRTIAQLEGAESLPLLESFTAATHAPPTRAAAIAAASTIDVQRAARWAARLMPELDSESQMASVLLPVLDQRDGSGSLARELQHCVLPEDPAKLAHRVMSAAGRSDADLLDVLNRAIGIRNATIEYSEELVNSLADRADISGDSQRGRQMFLSKLANCTACHQLDGQGGVIGPDLTIIGVGRSPQQLLESVLWPNRQIREGYMSTRVITDQGQIVTGYKVNETDDEIQLRDAATSQIHRIAKSSIEEIADAGSIMPTGLTAAMTQDELADLLRFLSELGMQPK